MKIIVATRDLDFGVGSVVKQELRKFDLDNEIKKIVVIGPKKLEGYSKKVEFEVIKNKGKFFITKEPYFAFKCNKRIKEILNKERIDNIYLHFPILAEKYKSPMSIKFHRLHKSDSNSPFYLSIIGGPFHFLYSYFDYRTIKYADKVLFVSKRTLEEAKKFYPQYAYKFYYSPNSVDKYKFFKISKDEKEKIKKYLGFDDGKKNLLFVGRLEPMKGILLLIKILEKINNPNIRLIVIGDGPLRKKIQRYPFVRYLGKIPNEELYRYYNIADLFVLPSYYENCPMTILEAKACGCKILASNVGDNSYSLSIKNLFEVGNINELKNNILKYTKNEK